MMGPKFYKELDRDTIVIKSIAGLGELALYWHSNLNCCSILKSLVFGL